MGWLGLDDTDHLGGGCTTWTMHVVLSNLPHGVRPVNDPCLVRLYPMTKARTRGNAALAAELHVDIPRKEWFAWLQHMWEEHVAPLAGRRTASSHATREQVASDPGMVWFEGKPSGRFYSLAVRQETSLAEAPQPDWEAGGLGKIGAIAAVSWPNEVSTWEGIAWRGEQDRPRSLDEDVLKHLDGDERLVACRDPRQGRGLLAPRGASPVLFGLRGTVRSAVKDGMSTLMAGSGTEPNTGSSLFRTNQGSGDHLTAPTSATVEKVQVLRGGHVALTTSDGTWLAFAPSGPVRDLAAQLMPGDRVLGVGLVGEDEGRKGRHLEGLKHLSGPVRQRRRPSCPDCGRRMKSAGRDQGLRCPACNHRDMDRWVGEEVMPTAWIQPPVDRRRHLAPDINTWASERPDWTEEGPASS